MHLSSLFASAPSLFMLIAPCASYKPTSAGPKCKKGKYELLEPRRIGRHGRSDLKLLREIVERITNGDTALQCAHRRRYLRAAINVVSSNAHQPLASLRSSIRSRLTSQYLSAERRSLSIPSASEDPLSSGISGRHCAEGLLDLCRVRFDLDIRQRLRRRAAPINIPPL